MARLLRQDWYAAQRTPLLWIICAVLLVGAGLIRLDTSMEMPVASGLGLAYAFIAAGYIGDLGASGRLDNQIISGCPRWQMWLAVWLTMTACFVIALLAMAAGNLLGALLRQDPADDAVGWLVYLVGFALNAAAYAGLYTLAALLITGRRAGRGVIALIVLVCIFVAAAAWGGSVDNMLAEPEMMPYYDLPPGVSVAVGDLENQYVVDMAPNPDYVGEPQRSQLEALTRFLPVTQSTWLHAYLYDPRTAESIWMLLEIYLYSLTLAAACFGAGALLFERRELD